MYLVHTEGSGYQIQKLWVITDMWPFMRSIWTFMWSVWTFMSRSVHTDKLKVEEDKSSSKTLGRGREGMGYI